MLNLTADSGNGTAQFPQNPLLFAADLSLQLAQVIIQRHNTVGLYIQGGPTGRAVVNQPWEIVAVGRLHRNHIAFIPLGQHRLLNRIAMQCQQALQLRLNVAAGRAVGMPPLGKLVASAIGNITLIINTVMNLLL